jgi:aminopeptidase N
MLRILMRDLEHANDDIFIGFLRDILMQSNNRKFSNYDFCALAESHTGIKLDWFFNQWLYITGMPELKITHRLSSKKDAAEIKIEQKQEALYSFPLELLINSQSGTISKQLRITERVTTFPVVAGKNYEIEADPEVKLLFREVK